MEKSDILHRNYKENMIKQLKSDASRGPLEICSCGITLARFTDGSTEQDIYQGFRSTLGFWVKCNESLKAGELVDLTVLERIQHCKRCGYYYTGRIRRLK